MLYLCKAGFSTVVIKIQNHTKITVEQETRMAGSDLILRFEKLYSGQQARTSWNETKILIFLEIYVCIFKQLLSCSDINTKLFGPNF